MRRSSVYTLFITCFLLTKVLNASSPAMHMYFGAQTKEIWEEYDLNFYNDLNFNSPDHMLVWKFYLLGLTLPDMFDQQKELKEKITQIHDNMIEIAGIPIELSAGTLK